MSLMGTAVSGMLGDTNWLSTISQNVANANTTGYKNAETEFATLVDQVGGASAAGGGVNTSLSSLNSLQGGVGTSTTTDLAIQGDGYFVVSDCERRPLSDPKRLVRARRRRQPGQLAPATT